jgi:hypothetical protein
MKVNSDHHEIAKGLILGGTATADVKAKLMEVGLTKAQATCIVRWQRKKLGKWKAGSGRHWSSNGQGFVHINGPEDKNKEKKSA